METHISLLKTTCTIKLREAVVACVSLECGYTVEENVCRLSLLSQIPVNRQWMCLC